MLPKKIAIFTSSRSDFGPLRRLIGLCSTAFDLDLIVASLHQQKLYQSATEIEQYVKDLPLRIVPIAFGLSGTTEQSRVQAISAGQAQLANWFAQQHYDAIVVLGDRWELFALSIAAFLFNIPIAHISGGEITAGAIDDSIRHAHTKLAHLHFVANATYARNVSAMGEEDWRITICGECGLDSIHSNDYASADEIQKQFDIAVTARPILVTYHPSTLDFSTSVQEQIDGLLAALDLFPDELIIFTAPASEKDAEIITQQIQAFIEARKNCRFVAHFGSKNYLAVMRRAKLVIGNSSSGLTEAASFNIPAINIGNRQKGRMSAASVIHTNYDANDIKDAIAHVLAHPTQDRAENPYDPFRDGHNSERIVSALNTALTTLPQDKLLSKNFVIEVNSFDWNTLLKEFK